MPELWRTRLLKALSILYVVLICLFIVLPIVVVILMSLNKGQYFSFPPQELSLRWYSQALTRVEWRRAFLTSIWIAIVTACLSSLVGILAGLALHRGRFRGRDALVSFFLSPLVLPQLLLGLALLFFLARIRLIGSPVALLLGHVLVTFPYVLRIILSSLGGVPRSVEEASMTMGANELVTTTLVTLPIIRPAVTSGAVFAFILSFDNIMISLFVASVRTVTLPVKVLQTIQETADPTIAAISSVFILVSLVLLVIVERTTGLQFVSEEVTTQ